jgi:hypothetical protein
MSTVPAFDIKTLSKLDDLLRELGLQFAGNCTAGQYGTSAIGLNYLSLPQLLRILSFVVRFHHSEPMLAPES